MIAGARTAFASISSPRVPRVASTVRSAGIEPSHTTATGVSASRPPLTSTSAIAAAFSTAIISSSVPVSRATASQSTSESAWSGGRWPESTVKSWATPRWVTGMPARAGTATGLVSPGITVTGTPAARQASTSSKPRPKTKLSPPLNRTTRLPASARDDDQVVDGLLGGEPPARDLRDVDQLGRAGQLAQQLARCEPVGDHDVGLHQRLAAGDRHQLGVAGPAADEHHAGRPVAVVRRGDGALAQSLEDLVAHGRRAARVAIAQLVAEHGHGDARGASHGGRPRRGGGRVVRAYAEDPARLGGRADRLVGGVVVGRGDDVPGVVEVARPRTGAAPSAISPASARASIAGVASGRDDRDHRAGRQQRRHPALGDVTGADHHHPPAGEPQTRGVRRVGVHPPMLPDPPEAPCGGTNGRTSLSR